MKKIVLFLYAVLFSTALVAQNRMSEINSIKRDKNYLYGEATLNTKEAAVSLAYELLEAEIKNWAKEQEGNINSVVVSQIYNYVDTIILRRHNMIRAFAYVKVANLNPIIGKAITIDIVEDSQPQPELMPVDVAVPVVSSLPADTLDFSKEVLAEIMSISSFYDLEKTIRPLHQQGKITSYGKYSIMPDPSESYLIIYDSDAHIRAVLDKGTTVRKNLITGKDDSETNYKGCGAIWFKLKK